MSTLPPSRRWIVGTLFAVTAGVGIGTVLASPRGAAAVPLTPASPPVPIARGLDMSQDDFDPFEGAVDWINTAGPIRWQDLRGKVVVLDFWTFCCINCHHVLPDLEKLEKKYGDALVVIGVHTAKFDAEKDTENIRKKVREYGIAHPIINDANMAIWTRFGVRSWPTLGVFGVDGKVVRGWAGEGHYDEMDAVIGPLVEAARKDGTLNETPLYFGTEKARPSNAPLLFPGKILADAAGGRLFLSDTAHHRIVVTDLDGKAREIIGTGEAGHIDGPFARAQFHRQQGLCLVGDVLYVADVENHMIRAVDLKARTVSTVAGTGKQGRLRSGGGPGLETPLNSPWDLVLMPETKTLVVAMAGPHQIWLYDLETKALRHWAGSGLENSTDGDLGGSAFAQPSGLATDGSRIFVADSEASAVRSIALGRDPAVTTVVGTHDLPRGQSLFAFGDKDGTGGEARLQHCLGVAYHEGILYVADTYNNKIKAFDPKTGAIRTLAGDRQGGLADGSAADARFDEPGGLSVADGVLYVADANNHAIRAIDLKTGTVATLALNGVEPPKPPKRGPTFPNATKVTLDRIKAAPGATLTLNATLAVPEGFELNQEAPMTYLVQGAGLPDEGVVGKVEPPAASFPIAVPLPKPAAGVAKADLTLSMTVLLCKKGSSGYCEIRSLIATLPVDYEDGAPATAIDLPAPAGRR